MDEADITRLALAEATGIPFVTLSRRLKGTNSFTAEELIIISPVLNVTPAYFFEDWADIRSAAAS